MPSISLSTDTQGLVNAIDMWALNSGASDYKHEMCVPFSAGSLTWTAMPAALNFFNASARYITYVDLKYYTGVNLVMNIGTAGATSGALFLRYCGSPSVTAANYLPITSPETYVRMETANTIKHSGFVSLVPGACSGVYLALMGGSGNAALSPVFGQIQTLFK